MIADIKNRYSFLHLVFISIIFLIYNLSGELLMSLYPDIDDQLGIILTLVSTFLLDSFLLLYILIIMKKGSEAIKSELNIYIKKKDILWGILAFLISLIPLSILSFFLPIEDVSGLELMINTLISGSNGLILICLFLLISIYAPFIEEFVFRGYIWKIFEEKKINKIIILFITSFLFAAIHLDLQGFPIFLTLGIIFGLLRMRTNRVGASIVAHIAKNTLALIAIYVDILLLG